MIVGPQVSIPRIWMPQVHISHFQLQPYYALRLGAYLPAPIQDYLHRVSVITTNDIWAVGDYYDNNGIVRTLAEHWNGTQWSVMPSPNVDSVTNLFMSVSAISSDDVWAVGLADTGIGALIE